MTFAELNAVVTDLRLALRSFVGESALGEVTVRPPANDDTEASFMRLVSWSYALLFEVGRITVPFLLELPANNSDAGRSKEALYLVHALRTWSSHNLGFDREHDVAISKRVQRWFLATCQSNPPCDDGCWQRCCRALCQEVGVVIFHCQGAVTSVLSAQDDGQSVIDNLHRRLERSWPAHEFDRLVGEAATRMGLRVDPRKFREPRLAKWRSFVECIADDDDPLVQLIRIIEQDLLDHTAKMLPINGIDVMDALALNPGPEVARALHKARDLHRAGVTDREELLKNLIELFAPGGGASATV